MQVSQLTDLERIVLDFTQMRTFAQDPFLFAEGEGVYLKDVDGKQYLDGLSGVFVNSLGYRNQAIIDAMVAQATRLQFAPPLHGTTPEAVSLVKSVLEFAPASMGAVKLLSGGSEATEAAMKMARQYAQQSGHPRKFKIIAKYGAYHGATMGALSASGGRERKSVFEPLVAGFLHVHPPLCYRCPYDKQYPDCAITCAKIVERTIESEDPATVAAVIMEPISISSAGYCVPPREFFVILREACDQHNVLLIYDEIITGFGRLGTNFAADHYGVVPDIICCGKSMSSGYAPLAAVIISERVWDAFLGNPEDHVEFHHGHTYGGNPIAVAVGNAALKFIRDNNLVVNAAEMGRRLRARLDAMYARFEIIGEVRGAGLLQGMEFVADRATRRAFAPDVKPGKVVERLAKERGLLLRSANDFVAFAPPLIVKPPEIDAMCDILESCLTVAQARLAAGSA
jgi:adenosylmethionine-8-amino-7-oxononanoate aminotransferase